MAKYELSFHAGCRCSLAKKTIEVDDEVLEGMSDTEIEEYIHENYYKDWVANLVEEHIAKV
jgi:hypothetical protein